MNASAIKAYLAQPSTILGFGVAGGTISGVIAHAATGSMTWTSAAALIVGALVHVVMPDNSAAQTSIEKLATDTIAAVVQKKLATAMPALFADGVAVVQAVQAPAVVVAPAPAPAPVVITAPAV